MPLIKRPKFLIGLISLFLLMGPRWTLLEDRSSIGEVQDEVRVGETLKYVLFWREKSVVPNSTSHPHTTAQVNREGNSEQQSPLSINLPVEPELRDDYTLKINGVNSEKIEYDYTFRTSIVGVRFPMGSLPVSEKLILETGPSRWFQYRFIPPELEEEIKLKSTNKEMKKFTFFWWPPMLPFYWLRLPQMKRGEEVEIEWEPLPYKLLGMKPPLVKVQFLGIFRDKDRDIALYRLKSTEGSFRCSLRLYYDLQLRKFIMMKGTFKKLEPEKPASRVYVRNYLLP